MTTRIGTLSSVSSAGGSVKDAGKSIGQVWFGEVWERQADVRQQNPWQRDQFGWLTDGTGFHSRAGQKSGQLMRDHCQAEFPGCGVPVGRLLAVRRHGR